MTKQVKTILAIAIIIIIAILAIAFWPKQDQPSNTNQPVTVEPDDNQPATTTEPEIITSDIDTSEWQTYRNEEYGFEVKYPAKYDDAKNYSVWIASNKEIGLLFDWGVNKGQEGIFSISAYDKNFKNELVEAKRVKILNKQIRFLDYQAEIIELYSLNKGFMIERDDLLYLIGSSFSENYYIKYDEYKEFYAITSTLKFFNGKYKNQQ